MSEDQPGRALKRLTPFLGAALFVVALLVLDRELHQYRLHDITRAFGTIGRATLAGALGLALLSYLVQTVYDLLALRYVKVSVPYRRVVLASFIGVALSNTVGHSLFTGASVRVRLYSGSGLRALQIATINTFCTATVWLGFLALAGAALVLEPRSLTEGIHLPVGIRALGSAFLGLVLGYLALAFVRRRPLKVRGLEIAPPAPQLATLQILVAALDWALCAAAFYILLPVSTPLSFTRFLGIFLLAQVAGIASQVPGGLGVFESVLMLLLRPFIATDTLLGTLLAFRIVYYVIPLAVAALSLAAFEIHQRRQTVSRITRTVGRLVAPLTPSFLAVTTFAGGVVLMISGATPAGHGRLLLLRGLIPLPAIEASHFLGSLTGFALMLLAWAVYRRVDVAWGASVALLAAGIVLSLAKGLDYEEAAVLATFLAALIPSRRYFYRRASLLAEPLRPGWLVAIGTVLAATLWLGFFSFKHVEYSHDLWWQFTLSAEAPRFLRAAVGVLSLAVAVSLARLLRPARPAAIVSTIAREHPARAIVASSPRTQANLVFLGDKAMLLNERASAFIMYGVSGRTWVAMGDPLGPEAEHAGLVRRFHEMCHRHGGRVAFYEVGKANLYLYLDIGLTVLKLGEEALVSLPEFTLEGGEYKHLRNITSRLERDGLRFEFLPRESVPDVLPELEEISDAWLEAKNTREKGFSLGFFDPGYLLEFPAALVRHEGRILAFANVWLGAGEELSVDLMRHRLDAPRSVMDFLFVRLMQWGREHGFSWFNLGMVPLKGLENRALVPLWHRLGAMVFRYGEHFYNFQGLRQFKEKFGPRWEPRYLAAPGGLALPRVVADIASLISRGLKGVVAK